MVSTKRTFPQILANLESKFYVSTENKSIFQYLKDGSRCPETRNFPLEKRMKVKFEELDLPNKDKIRKIKY